MNFQALKWMINTLVQTYKCPHCGSDILDNNIDIVWAAWTNINIDVDCPSCKKHSIIKAEMVSFDIWKISITKNNLNNLKNNLSKLQNNSVKWNENSIRDEEIINLNKDLKKFKKVSDLFNQE